MVADKVKATHKDGVFKIKLSKTALVEQIENGLVARGHGDEDVSALARSVREQSGID